MNVGATVGVVAHPVASAAAHSHLTCAISNLQEWSRWPHKLRGTSGHVCYRGQCSNGPRLGRSRLSGGGVSGEAARS